MVILQQPDSVSLAGNIKDFIINSDSDTHFTLSVDGEICVDEMYTPVGGKITIAVKNLVNRYLRLFIPDYGQQVTDQAEAIKMFTASLGTDVITFTVIKGGVSGNIDCVSFLARNFLTWQEQQKSILLRQPEWLTYYAHAACKLVIKAYFTDHTSSTHEIALPAGKVSTINTFYDIVNNLFPSVVSYYDIWVEGSGSRLTYIQRYVPIPEQDNSEIYIFENSLGGLDSFVCTGKLTEKISTEGTLTTQAEVTTDSSVDLSVSFEQKGFFRSRDEAKWLRDFFVSEQRYRITEDGLRKIYIADQENKFTISELNSFHFEYYYCDQTVYNKVIRNRDSLPELLEFPSLDDLFFLTPRLSEYPVTDYADDLMLPVQHPYSGKWMHILISALRPGVRLIRTLGELENVTVEADKVPDTDRILVQSAGSEFWQTKLLSDVTNIDLEALKKQFAALGKEMKNGQAIVWDDVLKVIKTVAQVPDAILWNKQEFSSWLDQPVRTFDEVIFHKVTAKELIEQVEALSPASRAAVLAGEQVSDLLTEEGGGVAATTLGELTNVDAEADAVGGEDVVLFRAKGAGSWSVKKLSEIGGGGQTTIQRNVRVVNNLDSKNISASKGEPCLLNFTFVSQERYSPEEPYEDTGERGLLQISARGGDSAEYVVVKQMYINSGGPFSVDIAGFLSSGANNIMIKVTGEVTEVTTPAFVYTVTLTSLSLSADNFRWWLAYTGNVTLPLNIGGNISKILHVTVTGDGYNKSYDVQLGTSIYVETAYNYAVAHPGVSGVYRISSYVSSVDGIIRTRTISFNVMCVVAGEKVKLVAVNNVLPKATNWGENALFDYAMYDGDEVTTAAQFVVKKDGLPVFTSNEDSITTSARHTLSFPMEIETIDGSEFQITVHVLDGETELTDTLTFEVNNSSGYSATPGAVFYLNPRTRSNRQENRLSVINEMDQSIVACEWKGMNWGNDGWTTDTEGNKVLRVMAGAGVAVGYKPFAKEAARIGKTIEIDYRIDNVTDFTRPVLTVSGGEDAPGLNVYADEVVMYSQSLKNRDNQGTMLHEGKRIRLALTILPAAYGNPGFNLCILYVNGVRNREFTYEDNDYFVHEGRIVIGSDYADIDVYGIRVYDSALTSQGVLKNYINWLRDNTDKKEVESDNDVMDVNGSEIDFKNTRDQFNVFVFDNSYPSLANPNKMKGTLEVFYADHPDWNVSVSNVEAKGQGTSSMRYWKWNVRFTLDKKLSVVTLADGSTTSGGWSMTPDLAKATKITAKKNFASSMHSHKIGSVNSVDDLYRAMGYLNEAMQTEKYKDTRVAVYQLPFVAFEKSLNEEGKTVYTFMGLYTMGPDKGDKNTFGYDTDLFPGLISIEGADNSPLCALFRVPWSSRMQYNEEEEAFQYNGANSWDFGAGDTANINKWIPAYNIAYVCSNRLRPFNGTLEELNAQVSAYRNEPYEFWIAKVGDVNRYNVYYYEASEGRFIASDTGEGTINLVSQLVDKGYGLTGADLTGKTADELNGLFIAARVQKFRQETPQYWDIDDAILHRNWVEFHAGTDNRAKNTYPYSFGNEGSRWKWRYDDLDTVFDTDNQGQAKKGYYVEFHDTYSTGGSVWNGETSNFWNLLDLAFPDEIWTGMRTMMTKMEELGGLNSGTDFDKLYAYFRKYYFSEAQEYFAANLYNADAKFTYENAKLAYMDGRYTNDTDPMTQALGDHYSAEQRWITKRILYMMSKYSFGIFSASGTDNITVRAAGNTIRYELIPAMDLYPAIANGTSIIRGTRTKAGEICRMLIELSGSGDQQNAIQGASYLQDIGDWYDKNVTGTMIIQGRMLREIRLGHKTLPIVISISALTISNCVSLQKLELSRIATLSGTLNLTACTHLKEVYIDGTGITQLRLPEGGGLKKIEFNSLSQYLILRNYPLITNEGVIIDECKEAITDFFIVDCPLMKPVKLLVDVMNAQADQGADHALKRIRAVGFEETYNSSEMLDKLAELADGSYSGLNSEGLAGEDKYPVLNGTLNIHASAYEDAIETLRGKFKNLILNITGEFYVRFKDKVIQDVCVAKWGDGVGIRREELKGVTIIDRELFCENTDIEDFSDFSELFSNCVTIEYQAFKGCSNLKSITFPNNFNVNANAFRDCENLVFELPESCTLQNMCFYNTGITHVFVPKGVKYVSSAQFASCLKLQSGILEEGCTIVIDAMFNRCTNLWNVILPSTIIEIQSGSFWGTSSLQYIVLEAILPPTLGSVVFTNSHPNLKIYVPDESVEAYKTATNWSAYASRIYPLSAKPE